MSNRRDDLDSGFFCNEPFCDGDHITSTASCYTVDDIDEAIDSAIGADYWGDGIYDSFEVSLNNG